MGCCATAPALPEVTEIEVVRHFTRLSSMNYGVDTGFYPLGSCTMKYNPKVNEEAGRACRASPTSIPTSRGDDARAPCG